MNQQEFYELPEVKAKLDIQKQNPYGSKEHKEAYLAIEKIADLHDVGDEYRKSGGGEY